MIDHLTLVPTPYLIHVVKPSYEEAYLEPFNDFHKTELSNASAEEAARFAVQYASGLIVSSTELARLDNRIPWDCIKEIDKKLYEVRECIENKQGRDFTVDDFLRHTDMAARHRIGNCGELCAVGARALLEFGYPGEVYVLSVDGKTVEDYPSNHAFLWVKGTGADDSWIADPLAAMMSPDLREKFFGDRQRPCIALKREGVKVLYTCLEKNGEMVCLPGEKFEKNPGISIVFEYAASLENGEIRLLPLSGSSRS